MNTAAMALVAALALGQGPAAKVFSVDAGRSLVRFHATHKLHKIDGESHAIEGKAALKGDGTLQVMVRIPVASFESGDGNRDSNLRDTLEAPKYPYVTYKGVGRVDVPASFPAKVKLNLDGVLDFHGRQHPHSVPVEVEFASATQAKVSGNFDVSLDQFEVERPSLMFIKMDDTCRIELELSVREGGS